MGTNDDDGLARAQLDRRRFLRDVGGLTAAGLAGRALVGVGAAGLAGLPTAAWAEDRGRHVGAGADRHPPTVLVEWYRTLYGALMDEGTTPPPAARAYACAAVAAHEAVVPGASDLRSLGGRLNGLAPPPPPPPGAVDWPAAVSTAVGRTLAGVLMSASDQLHDRLEEQLAAHLERRRAAGVPEQVLGRSVAHGARVARHVAAWASGDGADGLAGRTYDPPVGDALWRSTPPNFGRAIDPHWGSVRPMVLASADACAPSPPPVPFSTDSSSGFRAQVDTVLDAADRLDDHGRATALYWRDNPLTSGLPAGHWMLLTGQLASERGLTLDRACQVHVLAGVALADAFTSCWHEKYVTNLLRPVSYVRAHVPGREDWLSFVNTPQFPEYTSGHSVASRAVAVVLTEALGVFPFTDRTHVLRNPSLGTRSYASFAEAAQEAAGSRLLGGIHYPMGIEVGLTQGEHVGRAVLAGLAVRRRR